MWTYGDPWRFRSSLSHGGLGDSPNPTCCYFPRCRTRNWSRFTWPLTEPLGRFPDPEMEAPVPGRRAALKHCCPRMENEGHRQGPERRRGGRPAIPPLAGASSRGLRLQLRCPTGFVPEPGHRGHHGSSVASTASDALLSYPRLYQLPSVMSSFSSLTFSVPGVKLFPCIADVRLMGLMVNK